MNNYQYQSTSAYSVETQKEHAYDDDSFESCTSYSDEFLQLSPTM